MENSTTFKGASAVERLSSHTYRAHFVLQYSNGSAAHGGFVASIFMSVAKKHFDVTLAGQNQPHLLLFQLVYLSPTALSQAHFHVRDVKLGRLTSLIHVTLKQKGQEKALAYITHTNMASVENPISFPTKAQSELQTRGIPRQLSTLDVSRKVTDDWVTCWIARDAYSRTTTNVKFLLRQDVKPLCDELEEWIQFVDQRNKFTTESLGYVADMWPQILDTFVPGSPYSAAGMVASSSKLQQGEGVILDESSAREWIKYWYPTLSMNMQVHRALPPEGVDWLWQKVWATEISHGRMDIQVVIADVEGMIAVGSLSVMVVGQGRNRRAEPETSKSKI